MRIVIYLDLLNINKFIISSLPGLPSYDFLMGACCSREAIPSDIGLSSLLSETH